MIEARGLTKRYGDTVAVDDLTFTVRPGIVTGFLGPNGAGKSTTMRMLLGLDRPTAGSATVGGTPYGQARAPLREVGALLDAKDVHGGRTARAHLLALAQSNGLPARRVDEVLELTGLSGVAKKRIKGFSLGMSQRLGISAALLGDPAVLLFDEPVNGLDPEGILWIRGVMRSLAAEGRTVFVSSHLMSEMAVTAEHLVVIGRGRLIADTSTREFIDGNSATSVRVRSPRADELAAVTTGLSLLIDWAIVANWDQSSPADRARFDPTNSALNGLSLGQLATAVLGVLVITAEYSTGGIRTTFIAVPARLRVLSAKAVVVALLGLGVGLVTAFACFLGGMAIFSTKGIDVGLGAPGVLRAVLGAALYIAGCGMFGLAVGALLRATAGSITAVVALLFVLPLLTLAIPGDLGDTITKYFTANAGVAVTYARTPHGTLAPWAGYGAFTLEWLAVLAVGAYLLRRRDT